MPPKLSDTGKVINIDHTIWYNVEGKRHSILLSVLDAVRSSDVAISLRAQKLGYTQNNVSLY